MQSINARTDYGNSFKCIWTIYKQEGVLSFWSGATPRLARLLLSGGIVFTVYEFRDFVVLIIATKRLLKLLIVSIQMVDIYNRLVLLRGASASFTSTNDVVLLLVLLLLVLPLSSRVLWTGMPSSRASVVWKYLDC